MDAVYLEEKKYKIFNILIILLLGVGYIIVNNIQLPPYIHAFLILAMTSIAILMIEFFNLQKFAIAEITCSKTFNKKIPTIARILLPLILLLNVIASMYFSVHSPSYFHQIIYGVSIGLLTLVGLVCSLRNRLFLLSVVIINLLYTWTQLSAIPHFYSDDSQLHMKYVSNILNYGDVTKNKLYVNYPLMHIFVSGIVLCLGLDIKTSATISMTTMITFMPLLLFLILKTVYKKMITTTEAIILFSIFFSIGRVLSVEKITLWPTIFSSFLMILSLYVFVVLLFNTKERSKLSAVYIIASIATILSHSLTGLVLGILILNLGIIAMILNNPYRFNVLLSTSISFIIVLVNMMYRGEAYFKKLVAFMLREGGIVVNFATPSGSIYAKTIPVYTYILATLQEALLLTFAVIGALILLIRIRNNTRRNYTKNDLLSLYFSITSIVMGGIFVLDNLLKLGLASDRFLFYSSLFLPIPISIYLCSHNKEPKSKTTLARILILTLVIMITIPLSDILVYETIPLIKDISPQRYLEYSEVYSSKFLTSFPENYVIGTDNDFMVPKSHQKIILDFYQKRFDNIDGVIVRKFWLHDPVYSRGLYKLPYNIFHYFNTNSSYNLIYTTNKVLMFHSV